MGGQNSDDFSGVLEAIDQYRRQLLVDTQNNPALEENHAALYHSNSPANKKKRDEEFFFNLQVYEELKNKIVLSVTQFLADEQNKQMALDATMQKHAAAQNMWVMEEQALSEKNQKMQQEFQKSDEFINLLKKEIQQHLATIREYITKLTTIVTQIKSSLEKQKSHFMEKLRAETKEMLLKTYGQTNNSIEVMVGTEKVTITIQEAEKLIYHIAENEFSRQSKLDSTDFKVKVRDKFEALIASRVTDTSQQSNASIHESAVQITNNAITSEQAYTTKQVVAAYHMQHNEMDILENYAKIFKNLEARTQAIATQSEAIATQLQSISRPNNPLAAQLAQLESSFKEANQQTLKTMAAVNQEVRHVSLISHYTQKKNQPASKPAKTLNPEDHKLNKQNPGFHR